MKYPKRALLLHSASLKIAGMYLILGALWILFSDQAVGLLSLDQAALVRVSIAKGWGFMLVTTALLYGLIHHQTDKILKNEELYRLLAENTADVIWILDLDTRRFTYVSPAVERLRGFTPEEVLQQSMTAALTLESSQYLAEILPQRLADFQAGMLTSYTDQIDQPCKNGGIVATETTTIFFTNPQNQHTEVYGVSRDISERKAAEKKLLANQLTLKLFVEYAPAAIAMFDGDMRYIAASNRFLHDYRIHDQNIIGCSHYEIFPDIPDRWKDIHRRCLAGAVEKAEQDPFPRADGSMDWVRWEIHPWYRNAGEIGGIILFSEVITESKQAQNLALENEARYHRVLDAMMEGCQIIDFRWRYVYVNDVVIQQAKHTREELLGHTIMEAYPGIEQTQLFAALQQCMQTRTSACFENQFVFPTGEPGWFDLSIQPAREGIFILSTDVTARKRAEAELHTTLAELTRSNRELEQFAYIASHDLQEPLRAVAGMVQLLEQRYRGQIDERADEYIALTVDASERMQRLITDLLDYSRVNRMGRPFEPVTLEKCVKIALANLRAAIAESSAEIRYDPLPRVMADPVQITQVLQNLIGNAIKFRGERSPLIQISARQQEACWQIAVSDNGIGIDPKYFERIFLVFQRLHTQREYPGTGIGLSLCKKIIERHGGTIQVESKPGQGSTFLFTLPEPS